MDSIKELLSLKIPVDNFLSVLPTAASSATQSVDGPFLFVLYSGFLLFLIVVGPVLVFAIKYRRKSKNQKALSQKDHNQTLEILWSSLPLIYLMVLFAWGFKGFLDLNMAPSDSKELKVVGQKWQWSVQYPDDDISVSGQGATIGVALNKPVKLVMTSQDVIHSFFVPNFRVKQDVIPGKYTILWFNPTKVGSYPVLCTEFCGTEHSNMLAQIKVMPQSEYESWVASIKNANDGKSPTELGASLYKSKGCNACHSLDGSKGIAPTFKGVYGKKIALQDGRSVLADDVYMRESILEPRAKITKGYPPVMPSFQGQLSEKEINALIEFIKSIK